jgi:hypothetical protein
MAMFFAFPALFVCKLLKINKLLVEAAGVEPVICTENTQVTDTESAWNSPNSTIARFAYKSRTKNFGTPRIPAVASSDPFRGRSEVFSDLYTSVPSAMAGAEGSVEKRL